MLFGGAFSSAAMAQSSDSIRLKDFPFIKKSEAWLNSENAAGLHALPVDHVSIAEVYVNKQDGKFVNYHQSDNSLAFGAQTESFYRLNPKMVFYGKVGYSNFSGKNMTGSMFIDPYANPFDIVEFSDTNRGTKKLETYHLIGAISADVSKKITLGAKIDYTASNYAKQKDLRHVNKLLDMNLSAGMSYHLNGQVEIGANYYYRRSVEGLNFNLYGTTDKVYTSLISYGAFFGLAEQFGENGYTKGNEEKPMFNEYHGGALQLKLQLTSKLSLFNEFAYKSRSGYYGKKSPSTVVHSNHESGIWEYRSMLSLRERKNLHTLNINLQYESLNNLENVYRTENAGGGITDIVYYGTLDTTEKTSWNTSAEYVGYLGLTDFCPTWVVKGGAEYVNRKQTASVYPYYRKQNIHWMDFYLSGERNIKRQKGIYTVSLGGRYSSGGGNVKDDGIYATPSESQTPPRSMDTFLYSEYEYLTCPKVKGEIKLTYSHEIGNKGIRGYTSLYYGMLNAFKVKYVEGIRQHEISWTIGCTF